MHCVSEEEFQVFKQKATEVVDNHLGELDELIQESIRLINKIPAVASVFCCSGHSKTDGHSEKDRAGYIMLAATDLSPVYSIYNNIQSLTEGNQSNKMLQTTSHHWRLSLTRRTYRDGSHHRYYNAVIIGFPTRVVSHETVKLFNNVVQKAIEMTLDAMGILE